MKYLTLDIFRFHDSTLLNTFQIFDPYPPLGMRKPMAASLFIHDIRNQQTRLIRADFSKGLVYGQWIQY